MSAFRTIWTTEDKYVEVIDQRKLPHEWVVEKLVSYKDAERAIKDMVVRGAPLIGATAAYGIYLAAREGADLNEAFADLRLSRPTAVNLFWALDRMKAKLENAADPVQTAWEEAAQIVEDDVETCRMIGVHGLPLIEEISKKKDGRSRPCSPSLKVPTLRPPEPLASPSPGRDLPGTPLCNVNQTSAPTNRSRPRQQPLATSWPREPLRVRHGGRRLTIRHRSRRHERPLHLSTQRRRSSHNARPGWRTSHIPPSPERQNEWP